MILLTLELDHDSRSITPRIRRIGDNDKLNGFYHCLDCHRIDMASIDVDGHSYDVVFDDEMMFRRPLVPTLYVSDNQIFFGNIGFVKIDDEGGSISLDSGDIFRLMAYINRQNFKLNRWTENHIHRMSQRNLAVTA